MVTQPQKEPVAQPFTGASLIEWRERMGYSTREASDELGCSREALASWERGDTKPPRYIGLACHALALGLGDSIAKV